MESIDGSVDLLLPIGVHSPHVVLLVERLAPRRGDLADTHHLDPAVQHRHQWVPQIMMLIDRRGPVVLSGADCIVCLMTLLVLYEDSTLLDQAIGRVQGQNTIGLPFRVLRKAGWHLGDSMMCPETLTIGRPTMWFSSSDQKEVMTVRFGDSASVQVYCGRLVARAGTDVPPRLPNDLVPRRPRLHF